MLVERSSDTSALHHRSERGSARLAAIRTGVDRLRQLWNQVPEDGLKSSDVCKHCTHAACLDVCPTGAIFRTEFGTVVVQQDICNGCGYCVPDCPYGVLDKREDDGRIFKCTLCCDRLGVGQEPACAKACPTESIQFGVLDGLRERADAASPNCTTRASPRRDCTGVTPTTASVATAPSSCCSTSPRCTRASGAVRGLRGIRCSGVRAARRPAG
jgi:Fe-S-cluster-containing dehydrogenase component